MYKGYRVYETEHKFGMSRFVLDAPCGCPECDRGVQQGHGKCQQSPASLIEVESNIYPIVYREFSGGAWQWIFRGSRADVDEWLSE